MKHDGKHLVRLLVLIVIVLAIPVIPFLGFGDSLDNRVEAWLDENSAPQSIAAMVVGVLAIDILLPVPSSVVNTFAGERLGFLAGTAAAWFGMMLGAVLAFGLVRLFGRPIAKRLSSEEELDRMDSLAGRYGMVVLVLTRPVPLLAEAAVLLLATTGLSWGRFLLAVGLTNLGIAAAYAALGNCVELPVAIAASIAVPLLLLAAARYCWPQGTHGDADNGSGS